MPTLEELATSLHSRISVSPGLLRSGREPVAVGTAQDGSAGGPADSPLAHPAYGSYLSDWLEQNQSEPGRAFLGLLRSALGDLRAAISRDGGKFKSSIGSDG